MATLLYDNEYILSAEDLRINETPGVSGGYPCIGNTRISVRLLVEAFRRTQDECKVVNAFSQLTPDQVRAGLAYYAQNPARVDEDIERNAHAWAMRPTH